MNKKVNGHLSFLRNPKKNVSAPGDRLSSFFHPVARPIFFFLLSAWPKAIRVAKSYYIYHVTLVDRTLPYTNSSFWGLSYIMKNQKERQPKRLINEEKKEKK